MWAEILKLTFRMAEREAGNINWNMGVNGKFCCRIKVNHENP